MTPRFLLRHSERATNWKYIVDIIQQGKHPTNFALALAFGGSKRIPRIVRKYLSARFEHGWPRGGRTKTPWEKMESVGLNWLSENPNEPENPEDVFDAAIDVQYFWIFRNYCRRRLQENPSENELSLKAIRETYSRIRKMPPGWPRLDQDDVVALVQRYRFSEPRDIKTVAALTFEEVLREVSENHNVNHDRLAEFFRVGNALYDFR